MKEIGFCEECIHSAKLDDLICLNNKAVRVVVGRRTQVVESEMLISLATERASDIEEITPYVGPKFGCVHWAKRTN